MRCDAPRFTSSKEHPTLTPADRGQHALPTIDGAVAELRALGVIGPQQTVCTPLAGGSESTVAAVGRPGQPEIVVKLNPVAGRAAAEAAYLRTYARSPRLAQVLHLDPAGRYLAYRHLPGARPPQHCPGVDKAAALVTLARELLNHYRPVAATALAPDAERLAWQPGWIAGLELSRGRFGDYLPREAEALAVELAAAALQRVPAAAAWLLHGDPGPHNFLLVGTTLAGVVDPTVRVGEPIYDLARAFAAWPSDFSLETLVPAVRALRTWQPSSHRALVEAVLPPFYGQVVACLWHHPEDLPAYRASWAYWVDLLTTA